MVKELKVLEKEKFIKINYGSSFNYDWRSTGARINRGQLMRVIATCKDEVEYQNYVNFFIAQPLTNNLFNSNLTVYLNASQQQKILNSKFYNSKVGKLSKIHLLDCEEVWVEDDKRKPVIKELLDCKNNKITSKINWVKKRCLKKTKKKK